MCQNTLSQKLHASPSGMLYEIDVSSCILRSRFNIERSTLVSLNVSQYALTFCLMQKSIFYQCFPASTSEVLITFLTSLEKIFVLYLGRLLRGNRTALVIPASLHTYTSIYISTYLNNVFLLQNLMIALKSTDVNILILKKWWSKIS